MKHELRLAYVTDWSYFPFQPLLHNWYYRNKDVSCVTGETRELKEALSRARGDLEALKNERYLSGFCSVYRKRGGR